MHFILHQMCRVTCIFHFPLGFTCINFFSILLEEEGEAVMVKFNIKMRGQDQTGERDITDEGAPLIKV